jgi:ribosomal protein S18 acetylase RimI-like enzyme
MLEIQETKSKDIAKIYNIYKETINSAWSIEDFMNTNYYNILYSIKEEEKIVGFIQLKIIDYEAELINLAIMPEEQNKKKGTKSIELLLKELRKIDIKEIFLETREKGKAVNFYQNCGFVIIHTRKKYYQNNDNASIMKLEIK